MTPDDFIRTWSSNPLSERASAQSHFRDLCTLLDIDPPSPLTAGAFEFEKGAAKTCGGNISEDDVLAHLLELNRARAALIPVR